MLIWRCVSSFENIRAEAEFTWIANVKCYNFNHLPATGARANMLRIILLLLLTYSSCISARMYQWVDPDSGSTQLSGKPPMWYRSSEGGPRVFVFDKSKVIDDTGITVSDTERERLRQQAFLQAEEDKEVAKEKLLQAKRLNAVLEQKQKAAARDQRQEEPDLEDVQEEIAEEKTAETEEPSTIEQMRKLIADWEKSKTEKAKGLLNIPDSQP
jgi:hypothetical protein